MVGCENSTKNIQNQSKTHVFFGGAKKKRPKIWPRSDTAMLLLRVARPSASQDLEFFLGFWVWRPFGVFSIKKMTLLVQKMDNMVFLTVPKHPGFAIKTQNLCCFCVSAALVLPMAFFKSGCNPCNLTKESISKKMHLCR